MKYDTIINNDNMPQNLAQRYVEIRWHTLEICKPLSTEDYVVQPISDVSPPKWHLGHTTWFFETFILLPYLPEYKVFNPQFNFVFNSYYETVGARVIRTDRGNLSRPSVSEVYEYRKYVDEYMDAAAFWGSHIGCGVIETTSGDKETTAEIGTDILSNYFTKDKIYVYIQGEHERSYNYYDAVRKVYGFDPAGEIAQTNEWPIIIKQFATTFLYPTINFKLEYEIESSTDPIHPDSIPQIQRQIIIDVFGGNANPLASYPKIYRPELDSDQTESININFYGDGTQLYATFLFLYGNLKQKYPVEDYYNSLWSVNIDVPFYQPSENETAVYYANYNHNRLVNLDDTIGVGACIQNKIVFDNGLNETTQTRKRRRLYMAIVTGNSSYDEEYKGYNVSEITAGKYLKAIRKEQYSSVLYNDPDFAVYKGTFTDLLATPSTINSLCLVHHKNLLKKNSYYQLGITEEEYNKLVFNDPQPTPSSPEHLPKEAEKVIFHLKEDYLFIHERVRKYELGLLFEDSTGEQIDNPLFPTAGNEVYVYSMDGFFFFSSDYSNHQEFYRVFSKGVVEFRTLLYDVTPPNRPTIPAYNGEFGFDWLRVDDGSLDPRPSYESTIDGGYHRPSIYDPEKEYIDGLSAFRALKREYYTIPTQEIDKEYSIPYLTLFSKTFSDAVDTNPVPPYQANLRVYIDFPEYVSRIELEYDTNYFSIDPPILSDNGTTNGKVESIEKAITITCNKDFAIPQQIHVWAYPTMAHSKEGAQLAGVIIVNKNDVKQRKYIKAALINVLTDINNTGIDIEDGFVTSEEITYFDNLLYQQLVTSEIVQTGLVLNLTGNPEFHLKKNAQGQPITSGFIHHRAGLNSYNEETEIKLHTYLEEQFLNEHPQYNDYFLFFAFDIKLVVEYIENGQTQYRETVAGNIDKIGKQLAVLYRPVTYQDPLIPRSYVVLPHEAMHGFGLMHTHKDGPIIEPVQKYVYPLYETDNIMSYNTSSTNLWQWQKQFVKIKKE